CHSLPNHCASRMPRRVAGWEGSGLPGAAATGPAPQPSGPYSKIALQRARWPMEASGVTRWDGPSLADKQSVTWTPGDNSNAGARPKFSHAGPFQHELRRRVEAYFSGAGRRPRDCPQMYRKTVILFAWFIAAYVLLVGIAITWWQALPLMIALGL